MTFILANFRRLVTLCTVLPSSVHCWQWDRQSCINKFPAKFCITSSPVNSQFFCNCMHTRVKHCTQCEMYIYIWHYYVAIIPHKPKYRSCPHINTIISKASKRLYFLKQLRRAGVPPQQLLHFYMAVIRPVLEYASPVWRYSITLAQTEQLETIQKEQYISSLTSDVACHILTFYLSLTSTH